MSNPHRTDALRGTGPRHKTGAGRLIPVSVAILAIVAAIAGALYLKQDLFRGAAEPAGVAEAYIAAATTGDAFRARWLMPSGQEQPDDMRAHLERLRGVNPQAVTVAYVPHEVASYLVTARISVANAVVDELVLQKLGRRWYLVHFR